MEHIQNTRINPWLTTNIQRVLKQARIIEMALPLVPSIRLYLIDPDFPRRRFSDEELKTIMDNPPYWAFCWGSGQWLTKWILEHRETFQNRAVMDFGSGSGVAAIAAALSRARRVIALDMDPLACEAMKANFELNGVAVEIVDNMGAVAENLDIIVAADVLYAQENLKLLQTFHAMAERVLIADSRIKDLGVEPYQKIAEGDSITWPDLGEVEEFRRVSIYMAEEK